MKSSRFNLFFRLDNGRVVGYNSRTGSFLSLTEPCYEAVRHGISGSLDRVSVAMQALLAEFGFAVPDEMDELLLIRHQIMEARYSRNALGITIAPTLACNLRCVYCYEQGVLREGVMSPEVEQALLGYLESNVPPSGALHISWYGGEPLLYPEIVCRVSEAAKRIADSKNTRFSVSMVTNGTLLTQGVLDALSSLGGGSIQVTLDGPKRINDARKPFATGHGSSFDRILGNLTNLSFRGFHVAIRCNIDKTNQESALMLLDELRDLRGKGFSAYPAPVLHWPSMACKDLPEVCYSEQEFAPIRRQFERKAMNLELGTISRPVPKRHYCGADMAHNFTLGPDGALFKCWNHIGCEDLAVGNILYGHMVPNPIKDWTLYDPTKDEDCSLCSVLPLCLGGCPDRNRADANLQRTCDRWKFDLEETLADWAREWDRQVKACDCAACNAPGGRDPKGPQP